MITEVNDDTWHWELVFRFMDIMFIAQVDLWCELNLGPQGGSWKASNNGWVFRDVETAVLVDMVWD